MQQAFGVVKDPIEGARPTIASYSCCNWPGHHWCYLCLHK